MQLENLMEAMTSIKEKVSKKGYAIWKDAQTFKLIDDARTEYLNTFKTLTLHAQTETFTPQDLKDEPWRKLCIGATNGLGNPYAQFLSTTYFYQASNSFHRLGALFDLMVQSRNRLTGMSDDFGADLDAGQFWNACRVHHYPRGGGFMSMHRDTHFPEVLGGAGIPFLQVMACLSKRGRDFDEGGGCLYDKSDAQVRLDNDDSYGSFVFFDGSILHGVETIDANVLPNFFDTSGRVAAFTNLYKVM